jgi:hypothetical protein
MNSRSLTLVALILAGSLLGLSQTAPPRTEAQKPDELVREWFTRLNALDGSEAAYGRFVDLYQPDALQQVGPSANQYGPVFYQDQRQIRKWIQEFFAGHVPIPETTYFAIRVQTVNEKTANVIYITETPWGDSGGSVEFTARYVEPVSGKGFMMVGAAFFQFHEGKIARLRLYMPHEELMEITPPLRT